MHRHAHFEVFCSFNFVPFLYLCLEASLRVRGRVVLLLSLGAFKMTSLLSAFPLFFKGDAGTWASREACAPVGSVCRLLAEVGAGEWGTGLV